MTEPLRLPLRHADAGDRQAWAGPLVRIGGDPVALARYLRPDMRYRGSPERREPSIA